MKWWMRNASLKTTLILDELASSCSMNDWDFGEIRNGEQTKDIPDKKKNRYNKDTLLLL